MSDVVKKSKLAEPGRSEAPALGAWSWLLLLLGFTGLALVVYEPALQGEFISDDQHYIYANPYITNPTVENLLEMWNPKSVLMVVVENYAPVHLMLHAAEWQVFGEEVYGYHVVNVVLHALASALIVLFFRRNGKSGLAAVIGGAIFLAHSANVEAVAWMSQLKSPAAMVLGLGALLAMPRHPVPATLLFVVALFAKPSALFALPVLVMLTWLAGPASHEGDRRRYRWTWVAVWGVCFAVFAAVELTAFSQTGGYVAPLYEDPLVRLRSSAAIGLRYLAMATTTYGLSTFQEPEAVRSWLDPWWLGAVVAAAAIGGRIAVVIRGRRVEAVYWAWTTASYAAVSGLLPLPFPMADRYLYAILPGLIGVLLCVGGDAAAWVERSAASRAGDPQRVRRVAEGTATVAALVFAVALCARSFDRAAIWQSGHRVMADAELHYPNGTAAATRKATRAARIGDADTAVSYLRAAHARGYNRLDHLLQEPAYLPMRNHPGFRALLEEIASKEIRRLERNDSPSQLELHVIALAYQTLRDTDGAIRALERALELEGPIQERLQADLVQLRAQRKRERR
ncbi:MAG: hypothetical protein O7G30_06850 [Proteobacteria bacterium]|nr:hypothetical protein [Pseudomonadota bacterium]